MDTKYLRKQVMKALQDWYKPNSDTSPLEELCLFHKIKRTEQCNNRRATNHLLYNALKQLKVDGGRHGEYLELRYRDEKAATWVSDSWGFSESAVFGIQRLALARLTDIIIEEEAKLRTEQLELSTLQENLYEALKCWSQVKIFESPISYLKIVEQKLRENALDVQTAGDTVILEALDRLKKLAPVQAEILISRFINNHEKRSIMAKRLNIAESTVSKRQGEAIESLTRIVYDMEMNERGGYHDDQQIRRLIEIPSEYKQEFVSLMSYFSHVIEKKYPKIDVGVTIEQQGTSITLIISTPEGEKERIEKELTEYGLVLQGKVPPDVYFNNSIDALALKQKLEIVKMELRLHRESREMERRFYDGRIDSLERQIQWMGSLIDKNNETHSKLIESIRTLSQQATGNSDRSFDTILEILERGITLEDVEDVAQALSTIRGSDKSTFSQLSKLITEGAVQGVTGNYLYQFLLELGMRLP